MDYSLVFKLTGALGLVFITAGVLTQNRIREEMFFVFGGVLLEVYSVYLRDIVFIPLQIIFIAASSYELYRLKKGS